MKKYIYLLLFLLFLTQINAFAQEKIIYVFSDTIEETLNQNLKDKYSNRNICLYLMTNYIDNEISFYLFDVEHDFSDLGIYARLSNRYAIIGCNEIPIVLDVDFRWGTTTRKDNLGDCGKRDGLYKRSILIIDSPPIIKVKCTSY